MAVNALQEVKKALNGNEIKTRFNDIMGSKASQFMASITNVVAGSDYLQNCDPASIMAAAFIAASLDLPIDPNLGRAYIIPYGKRAQFQIGYKGLIELAIRTGQYKDMNAVEVYEDEILEYNPILGKLKFVEDFSKCKQRESGDRDKVVGYYAYYELLAGFAKGLYMTKAQIINHAERYSQAYQKKKMDSPWFTNFDEMAKKTVLKRLLSKWGILSVEMQKAVVEDQRIYDADQGYYTDNSEGIPAETTDELAQQVVGELTDKIKINNAPLTEAVKPQAIVNEPVNVINPVPQDDFAQFDQEFMNLPDGIDGELPFR